jgi:hypothetical protein
MSTFDPFNQAKLQNGYSKLKDTTVPEKDMTLDELKKLSGAGKITGEPVFIPNPLMSAKKAEFIRDNNLRPGDKAWFKAMFAKPHLTGEDPFSK